jgi:hypothetical protein
LAWSKYFFQNAILYDFDEHTWQAFMVEQAASPLNVPCARKK